MNSNPLTKHYGQRLALDIPSLCWEPGKIYAVFGANGSGKSTLAKILAGVMDADGKKPPFPAPVSLSYMPQKCYAFRMSTEKNILLGGSDKSRADLLMEQLGLSALSKQNAGLLSGGETARMALARLFMEDRELYILDEPCAGMDMEGTLLAEELIRRYCLRTRCAVILVTHSLQQARRIADEALFLSGGQLIEQGSAQKLLSVPENPATRQFLNFYGMK